MSDELINSVQHLPALDLLQLLPDGRVDLGVIDCPYGIDYKSNWKTGNGGEARIASPDFGEDTLQLDWIPEFYRVLKPGGALYLFTRWDVLHHWQAALEAAGFEVAQRIVWDKLNWGMGDLRYFGSQTEDILFCVKGEHRIRLPRSGNVWRLTKLDAINHEGNEDNPAQKPERLLRRAILNSSDVGDLVCDPFCGSGSTGAAARSLGRRYVLGDRDLRQVEIARSRLAEPYAVDMFEELREST